MNNIRRKLIKEAIEILNQAQDLFDQTQEILSMVTEEVKEEFEKLPYREKMSDSGNELIYGIEHMEDANGMIEEIYIKGIISEIRRL